MTPSQLSAIRARLDGGLQPLPSQGYALLDEVERLTAELDVSDSDDRLAVKRLTAEVERLTKREDELVKAGLDLMVALKAEESR